MTTLPLRLQTSLELETPVNLTDMTGTPLTFANSKQLAKS